MMITVVWVSSKFAIPCLCDVTSRIGVCGGNMTQAFHDIISVGFH